MDLNMFGAKMYSSFNSIYLKKVFKVLFKKSLTNCFHSHVHSTEGEIFKGFLMIKDLGQSIN